MKLERKHYIREVKIMGNKENTNNQTEEKINDTVAETEATTVPEPEKESPKKDDKKIQNREEVDDSVYSKVALQVKSGQFGTGETLKNAIIAKGLDYNKVMKMAK